MELQAEIKDTVITNQNFWKERDKHEKRAFKTALADLKWQCGLSLSYSIIQRLILSYLVLPATFVFAIFILESISEGLTVTFNTLFIGNTEPLTNQYAASLVDMYHAIALVIFTFTWLSPWTSPARKRVNAEMEQWWNIHGNKLPGLVKSEQ